jgi:hypothetical protein
MKTVITNITKDKKIYVPSIPLGSKFYCEENYIWSKHHRVVSLREQSDISPHPTRICSMMAVVAATIDDKGLNGFVLAGVKPKIMNSDILPAERDIFMIHAMRASTLKLNTFISNIMNAGGYVYKPSAFRNFIEEQMKGVEKMVYIHQDSFTVEDLPRKHRSPHK